MVTGHSATKGLKQKVATKASNKVGAGGGGGAQNGILIHSQMGLRANF